MSWSICQTDDTDRPEYLKYLSISIINGTDFFLFDARQSFNTQRPRRHFNILFQRKVRVSIKISSICFNRQKCTLSDNSLAPNRWRTVIWTNVGIVYAEFSKFHSRKYNCEIPHARFLKSIYSSVFCMMSLWYTYWTDICFYILEIISVNICTTIYSRGL